MRVAVCQMNAGEDVAANLEVAVGLLREAAEGGADLAALPEYFGFLGASARRAEVAEPIPGPVSEQLAEAARAAGMWVLGGGLLERDGSHVHDTAALFDRAGEVVARYRKIHLYDVELPGQPPFRESATITPGDELMTHEVEDTRVGLSICYDVRFPELYRGLMALGAEVLMVPAQFQHATGSEHWHALLRARAIENLAYVVAPGQWGAYGAPERGRRSYGHSLVVDPWGRVVAEAPEEGTGVWFADLDLTELRRIRRTFPALQHRRLGFSC
jgi:deaminated glutathione amidase